MDKKNFLNTAIGVGCIAAAIGLFVFNQQRHARYAAEHPELAAAEPAKPAASASAAPAGTAPAKPDVAVAPVVVETPAAPERTLRLANGTLSVDITTHGAAVKIVSLPGHAAILGKDASAAPVLFNEFGKIPALALSFPDPVTGKPVAWRGAFAVKEKTDTRVVLEAKRADGLVVTREFTLAGAKDAEPHLLHSKTTFRREAGSAAAPVVTALNLGTLPPTEADSAQRFLNVSAYDGDNYEVVGTDKFKDSSGILGIGAHVALPDMALAKKEKPFSWFAVSNQFFAGIAILDEKSRPFSTGMIASPVELPAASYPLGSDGKPVLTVTADAGLDLGVLAPGESKTVVADFFVGPKEYKRLAALGDHEDEVVQFIKLFGFISVNWLCKMLMTLLSVIHGALMFVMPGNAWNWGIAIVTLTVLVKAATWPLTGLQMKAAENMKKLQEPMKALKEKYKDNPQKLQQETMLLYRTHRVNPVAGCVPVLIQIPIFTGLYTAFQTTAELRHQPFLWFADLSVADRIPGLPDLHIGGMTIGLHILPLLMGVAMLINMRMTPMTNVDPNQKTIFYVMMAMFPVICYTMPAGLTTYYTVNNSLTVLQSWLLKRKRLAKEAAEAPGTVEVIPPAKSSGKRKKKA